MMRKTLTVLIVIFSLAGVLVSTLAFGEHYNTKPAPCDINEKWDCGIVNHSPYAAMHDVPVALVGVLGYALLAAIAGRFPRLTAVLSFLALIFTVRLSWIEWKVLGVWCIYCVSSQGLIALIFLLSLLAAIPSPRSQPGRSSLLSH